MFTNRYGDFQRRYSIMSTYEHEESPKPPSCLLPKERLSTSLKADMGLGIWDDMAGSEDRKLIYIASFVSITDG